MWHMHLFFVFFCFLHAHVHFLLSIEFNGVEWRPHCFGMGEYLCVRVAKGGIELIDQVDQGSVQRSCA